MPLRIIKDNITNVDATIIVNDANRSLQVRGGVCRSIFDAAGYENMESACKKIGSCEPGKAVITDGFNLKAKYVIHTVGPAWAGGNNGEEEVLRSCYRESLSIAKDYGADSIAIPIISSELHEYPKSEALTVAISEVSEFLRQNEMLVYIVAYDKSSFQIPSKLFNSILSYIDEKYIKFADNYRFSDQLESIPYDKISELSAECRRILPKEDLVFGIVPKDTMKRNIKSFVAPTESGDQSKRRLADVLRQLEESFSESLLRLIDEKGKDDVEVYKKANIDRKHFSKIRSNKDYRPTKPTVLAFAIALELSLDETKDLLARAGFTLTHSSKSDIVIEYFIIEKNYNIFEINEVLFALDLPMLI